MKKVKTEQSEIANAEPMEVEPSGSADDDPNPALGDELDEDADA